MLPVMIGLQHYDICKQKYTRARAAHLKPKEKKGVLADNVLVIGSLERLPKDGGLQHLEIRSM
jgi:hypothetical protein